MPRDSERSLALAYSDGRNAATVVRAWSMVGCKVSGRDDKGRVAWSKTTAAIGRDYAAACSSGAS